MVQFECSRYWNPRVSLIVGGIPFLISSLSLSGVIDNWTPQYESLKGGTLLGQN